LSPLCNGEISSPLIESEMLVETGRAFRKDHTLIFPLSSFQYSPSLINGLRVVSPERDRQLCFFPFFYIKPKMRILSLQFHGLTK